jgi:hypothetical protein
MIINIVDGIRLIFICLYAESEPYPKLLRILAIRMPCVRIRLLAEQQMRRMETEELHFFRAGAGYRMPDHKHNGDITRELGITD